jgi:hypothetical protein
MIWIFADLLPLSLLTTVYSRDSLEVLTGDGAEQCSHSRIFAHDRQTLTSKVVFQLTGSDA